MSINKRHLIHKILLFIAGFMLGVYITMAYTTWVEITTITEGIHNGR